MPFLYHLSPEKFEEFDPSKIGGLFGATSSRTGEKGVFFAPNFKDILKWADVISGVKGQRARNSSKKQKRINREYKEDQREYPVPYPPKSQGSYFTLFLYKVEVKRSILEKILEHNMNWNLENSKSSDEDYRSPIGFWETEIFVPEDFLPYLNIVSVKRYKSLDLTHENNNVRNRPKSSGYYEYIYKDFKKSDEPTFEEEYELVYEARKKFDSEFSIGQKVFYEDSNYNITGIEGKYVVLKGPLEKKVNILDFLKKVKPEDPKYYSWYTANRRKTKLLKIN